MKPQESPVSPTLSPRRLPQRRGLAVLLLSLLVLIGLPHGARAQGAPFDLDGPRLQVQVSRGGVTLPLARVPNLAAGDQITVGLQSRDVPHSVLILAFLRGASGPPPRSWFIPVRTWGEGAPGRLHATVPQGAEQALLFLAPATGGDFDTIVNAVSGRPGAFVRAAQDLNQSSRDRMRLDAYVKTIRQLSLQSPGALKTASPLLARSLLIKLDPECLLKTVEQQAGCLTEGREALVLSDGRDVSLVQTLTSGVPADLVQQLSATPKAGLGYFSPYISSAMDIARLLDGFHTAQYQYIPALMLPDADRDEVRMMLNTPPSFYNPKSVMVAALPPISPPPHPAFALAEPTHNACLAAPGAVLPLEGVPIAFATAFAQDLVLRVSDGADRSQEIPVRLDPVAGGLVPTGTGKPPARPLLAGTAHLTGRWGFDSFQGPDAAVELGAGSEWKPPADPADLPVAGTRADLILTGEGGDCLEGAELTPTDGKALPLEVHARSRRSVTLSLPASSTAPGPLRIALRFRGQAEPVVVQTRVYAPLPTVRAVDYHQGDRFALVQTDAPALIQSVTLNGQALTADPEANPAATGPRPFTLPGPWSGTAPAAGERLEVSLVLTDGRVLHRTDTVGAPRPAAAVVSRAVTPPSDSGPIRIYLGTGEVAPLGSVITFALRATDPKALSARTTVQVSADGGQTVTTIGRSSGLVLVDAVNALVKVDTGALFDRSTHGPLLYRLVANGMEGDWQPVVTLVRLPRMTGYACTRGPQARCRITGESLVQFLALSADETFQTHTDVPVDLTAPEIEVPGSGTSRTLFVKLRDDPATAYRLELPRPRKDRDAGRG